MDTERDFVNVANVEFAPAPNNIIFEITYRCNLKCQMCYLKDSYLNQNIEEVSLAEIENFLDSLPSKPNIILTGGEPFCRSDILEIVAAVKKRGMKCIIFSNGTLLSKSRIKTLIDLELDSISFSLDGPRNIFEEVTLVPGSFDRLERNLKTLIALRKNLKPKITISCVISKKNIDEINFLMKHVENPNIDLISFLHLHFVSDFDSERNLIFLSERGIKMHNPAVNRRSWGSDLELATKIVEFRKLVQDNPKIEFVPDINEQEILSWYGDTKNVPVREYCFYPWSVSRIAPDGSVYICQNQVINIGNIKENNFMSIWNSPDFLRFRANLSRYGMFPGCNRCCKVKTYTRSEFPSLELPSIFP